MYKEYQEYNIEDLDRGMRSLLAKQVDDASEDFFIHREQVNDLLLRGDKTN